MAYANTTRAGAPSVFDRIAAAVATVKAGAKRREVYRRTWRELDGLSERDLADLGIHRTQIREVAYEAAYGK